MKDGVSFFGKNLKHGDIVVNDFELNLDYPGNGLYTFIIYYKRGNIIIIINWLMVLPIVSSLAKNWLVCLEKINYIFEKFIKKF